MTIEEALERVERIRNSAGDDEVAHSMEDDLRRDVLEAIARHTESTDPVLAGCAALAEAALTTSDISFARWCA